MDQPTSSQGDTTFCNVAPPIFFLHKKEQVKYYQERWYFGDSANKNFYRS